LIVREEERRKETMMGQTRSENEVAEKGKLRVNGGNHY
jgi:hypothetical protein